METVMIRSEQLPERIEQVNMPRLNNSFIEANTIESSLEEVKESHIIPVFVKDNETLISHTDFIEAASDVVADYYQGENILRPNIRLSHPVKGRIPEAKDKPANALLEHEKTIYYERMAFLIELPGITDEIDGNTLSLSVGGIKAYNLDNLYGKKGSDQHFKIFIGFNNKVCTNLCVWTDGLISDLKVKNLGQLQASIRTLIEGYNAVHHLHHLRRLVDYSLTEQQFALLVGRCKLYQHLPNHVKQNLPVLMFGDYQTGTVVKDYYSDKSFCRNSDGSINLWKLYNLFTGANKSTYIDQFLDRSSNAYSFVEQIRWGLEGKNTNWYIN